MATTANLLQHIIMQITLTAVQMVHCQLMVAASTNDRILVKNQTDTKQNVSMYYCNLMVQIHLY